MARDRDLEELLRQELGDLPDLGERLMFGGLVFLLNAHLLCGARADGMIVRLGKGNDDWACAMPGVATMRAGTRPMSGWVRVDTEACGDDKLRRRLIDEAINFVGALPAK